MESITPDKTEREADYGENQERHTNTQREVWRYGMKERRERKTKRERALHQERRRDGNSREPKRSKTSREND